jgi:hypothetical protein
MMAEEERAQLKKELAAERAKTARPEGELARCVGTKIELHPSHNPGLISQCYIFSASPTDINRNLFLDRGMLLFF